MPVLTKSQILVEDDENGDTQKTKLAETFRNPHSGLKEKLKALTVLYEQQKLASVGWRVSNVEPQEPKSIKIVEFDRNGSFKKPENDPILTINPSLSGSKDNVARNVGFSSPRKGPISRNGSFKKPKNDPISTINHPPLDDLKYSVAKNAGFSSPRKGPVPRKLSLGSQLDAGRFRGGRKTGQEMDTLFEKQRSGTGKSSKIMVFKEKELGSRSCVRIVNQRDVYLTEFASENDYFRLKRLSGRHFSFDASFSESSTQLQVYSTTTAELVEAVLQGRNGSVFCYGATGAGKTYTMLGTVGNPGVMVLAIKDLFTKIRRRSFEGKHMVHLSYLEVYNETVRDLLSPGRPLVLREDKQGIVAAGLSQYRAYTTDEVMALLLQGNKNRTTESTRANEMSSRSHAMLQVTVEYQTREASMTSMKRVGKLSLIDLAGSERALATDQRTVRSLEGANINRSLLALSSCINALVEGKKHIPYRNSKLTQLLKDSLGGACNTVMIANISPSNFTFGETQNTLHWADRAKEIRNKEYETNEELVQGPETVVEQAKLLLEVQHENRQLRLQLAKQQQKLQTLQAQSCATPASPTSSISSINQEAKAAVSSTPEQNKKNGPEATVRELQLVVKALRGGEIERMRREHSSQLKKKDDKIKDLTAKLSKGMRIGEEGLKMFVLRASVQPKIAKNGDVKTPGHRFQSPVQTAKKRSFWDITSANSPSSAAVNGRKTRSHVKSQPSGLPSMLFQLAHPCFWSMLILGPLIANYILQPGFSRHRH
ncbi:hypothetical protein RND81_13G105900 [Saponaria officinalis]|uniref:Kinesin-like protein n=1 Tax=Saponaria officinalis TaxID=3572 RepID=A0AAW1GYA0_SAPOF